MEQIITKKCTKCGLWQPADFFGKDKKRKDGKNPWCKQCCKTYYTKNKVSIIERVKIYMASRKKEKHDYDKTRRTIFAEKIKDASKEYFQNNKSYILAKHKEYVINHPEKVRMYNRNRKARILWNGGVLTAEDWKEVIEKYGNVCLKCGSDQKIEIDHVIPVSLGGINDKTNVQPLCRRCNRSKGAKFEDYR